MKQTALLFLLFIAMWSAPAPANALLCSFLGCSCNVTATPIDFQNIDALGGPQHAEGEITIDCTGLAELTPSMTVRMEGGTHGTIAARKMRSPAGDLLDYNLYTTDQHTVVWGTGTTGSAVNVSGGFLALGHWTVTRRVYARVTPSVATKPGAYTDNVVVRIDW